MIHVVTTANHHLYARQLLEMRDLGRRRGEEGSAWLMALGPEEELLGHLWIRPAGTGAWQVSAIWVDGASPGAHAGLHRLLAAAAERALAVGGTRLVAEIDAQDYARLIDGPLAFRISGPPVFSSDGAMLDLACELEADALEPLVDSLGEPRPLTYLVEDDDLALHGGLARVQEEVDLARHIDMAEVKIDQAARARATARIDACFARCDARTERAR